MGKWESKCYTNGIPDSVPNKLLFSGRAPSYKAIAICILAGDLQLRRLGLNRVEKKCAKEFVEHIKRLESDQIDLFTGEAE